jgi:hypothetical protein
MAKVKTTFITVEGRGRFPLDMLRYDHCWPYTTVDSARMAPDVREKRKVVLLTNSPNAPTPRRWFSFNWTVVED